MMKDKTEKQNCWKKDQFQSKLTFQTCNPSHETRINT
jgi:hypothetical protein